GQESSSFAVGRISNPSCTVGRIGNPSYKAIDDSSGPADGLKIRPTRRLPGGEDEKGSAERDSPLCQPLLRGISFEVRPGEHVALVGRSGSGKTTIGRLLLGLYQPAQGRVLIDGWDLAQVDLTTYRRQVGVVLQENLLFSGTIRDNIAQGDTECDAARLA